MSDGAVVSDCRNAPVPREQTAGLRRSVVAWLRSAGPATVHTAVPPATALLALFSEQLDPWLAGRLQALYNDRVLLPLRPAAGFVYVFRDNRDPEHVYKLGATRQRSPHVRLQQWRRALDDAAGQHVFLQFYTATADPFLAEAVLHTLLYCRQLSARVNRFTNARADEYFFVPDVRALRYLCQAVGRHVDAFTAARLATADDCRRPEQQQ